MGDCRGEMSGLVLTISTPCSNVCGERGGPCVGVRWVWDFSFADERADDRRLFGNWSLANWQPFGFESSWRCTSNMLKSSLGLPVCRSVDFAVSRVVDRGLGSSSAFHRAEPCLSSPRNCSLARCNVCNPGERIWLPVMLRAGRRRANVGDVGDEESRSKGSGDIQDMMESGPRAAARRIVTVGGDSKVSKSLAES